MSVLVNTGSFYTIGVSLGVIAAQATPFGL